MVTVEVVVKKTTASLSLGGNATFGDLMKRLFTDHGIDVSKQVILYQCKEFRMPPYEQGKLVIYDGEQREVTEDRTLAELKIDGSEALVCGELQDEWLEEVKWGAFGHTLYEALSALHGFARLIPVHVPAEADYLNHREFVPAPFARPAFTWSAQAPPGGAVASVQGTRLISAPQMTSMPAQYVVDRGSYQQPTWPTTVINNPQILPGSRFT
ncbi:unnamed protein product [Symbiodinium necroappetens]|uniref:Ubiquitin-like domain-containing protein n=1 Tax=Symbiodinium necroappetens TaxID=1628268 RepID=A0A812RGF1_9DINO|nr:unnamed protein product [Symbiodinium necroappetens]